MEILVDAGHGQGEPPTIYVNVLDASTLIVSPALNPAIPSSSIIVKVTVVTWGGSPRGTPGWQQTAFMIKSLFGQVVLLSHVKLVSLTPDVTAATLAPCLTPFLRELFVYHARANSVMPKSISNNRKSIKAVSISVCPFCFLNMSMFMSIKVRPSRGPAEKLKRFRVVSRILIMGHLKRY